MTTEAMTETEAARERAAIRKAGPLYVGKAARTEAEARKLAEAEAATTGTDTTGKLALGAIVETDTAEARARAEAARKARAALPAIEWIPAPKVEPRKLTEAEIAEARKAEKAEARKLAAIAREIVRVEHADRLAAEARAFRRAAIVGNAESMFAELKVKPEELKAEARKARATGKLKAAEARAAFLAESGMTEAEARAEAMLADELMRDGLEPRKAKDAGQVSVLSPAELAQVDMWTRAMLASPAARAGRQALEAIGPNASAMVVTNVKARKVTIAKVCRVPKVEIAEARAGKAEAALEAARARLTEAEAAEAAARAEKAVQPIRKAEAEANRISEIVGKAAARASKANLVLAEARQLADRPAIDGMVYMPLGAYALSEAARAGELELPVRKDRMPARYAHRGPQAKGLPYLTDNTAKVVIGEMMKLTEAELKEHWQDTFKMIRAMLAEKAAAEAAEAALEAEASKAARKAYKAAHERDRRARARK